MVFDHGYYLRNEYERRMDYEIKKVQYIMEQEYRVANSYLPSLPIAYGNPDYKFEAKSRVKVNKPKSFREELQDETDIWLKDLK